VWIVAPLIFFAGMVAVRANFFLSVLNVCACVALLCLLVYYYAKGHIARLGLFGYPIVMMLSAINAIALTGPLVSTNRQRRQVARSDGVRRTTSLPFGSVLRGIMLALPILILFAALLASADTIFANYLSQMFNLDFLRDAPELLWRLVIVLCAAWLVAGGLAYGLRRRGMSDAIIGVDSDDEPAAMQPGRLVGAVEANTVLVAVNLLFVAFVLIQFAYLFSGRTLTTLADSDYKHYARRGFGELIAVSVLTLGMILMLRWLARLDNPSHMRLFNALGSLMVGLSLVILSSAWMRMFYWEDVADYIATALRLYVRVFIVWLGLLYVWLVFSLWTRPALFAVGAFVAAMGFLGTLDVMNPDENVVQYNVERAAVRELYFPYMQGLSEDSVPALVAALDKVPPSQNEALRTTLYQWYWKAKDDPNRGVWQSFNLGRAGAYDALQKNYGRFAGK
jgi:hypothetical protein